MPEGPEVTLMVNTLRHKFKRTTLKNIEILSGRYTRHGVPKRWRAFHNDLPAKIVTLSNKGKMVWLELDNGWFVKIVPAMTGHLELKPNKYARLQFITSKGSFYLNDMRNFASIHLLDPTQFQKELDELGPFPLDQEKLDVDEVLKRFRRKSQRRTIAEVMLEQDVMAGVGNYIRSDALYVAGIAPTRTLNSISDKKLKELIRIEAKVMRDSYDKQKNGPRYYPDITFKIYRRHDIADKVKIKGRYVWWNKNTQK